jgi:TonB-linked SusC/RagA family outer membrane protein
MKIILLLIALLGYSHLSFSQTVEGVVKDVSTSETIFGAVVVEKNTENKVRTDIDGKFSITVSDPNAVLVVRSYGYLEIEYPTNGSTSVEIMLTYEDQDVGEVVITALALERETKDLGFAVQSIEGDELSEVKSTNVLDNLAGRVAGVTISHGATGVGSTSKISIRGESSFTNNNPLFVVDGIIINNNSLVNTTTDAAAGFQGVDFGNGAMDINADDIESVTVLKGPSAAALYGTRASNGVVIFTTKTGRKKQGLGISINSTTYVDDAFRLPDFQNRYGQGNNGAFEYLDGQGGGINDGISYSWGPQLDNGYMTAQYDSPVLLPDGTTVRGADLAVHGGAPITPTEMVSNPDNLKNFYQLGYTSIQNIAFSNGFEKSDMRVSITDMRSKGIIPGVNLDRMNVSGNFNFNPSKKLTFSTRVHYANTRSDNRPASGYGSENTNYALVAWGPRSLNIDNMRDYWQPGLEGLQQYSFNYLYFDNPYFTLFENRNSFQRDRMIGNIVAKYEITENLSVSLRSGMDYSAETREFRRAYSSNRFKQGAYAEQEVFFRENNTDFLVNYNREMKDISIDLSLGGNRMDQYQSQSMTTAGALSQPGIYRLSNASIPLAIDEYVGRKRINSLYGLLKLGYKDYLYLDLTARNDWSSALATPASSENVSFFYPSASASFVLSNLVELPKAISFAKIRAGIAQVGNDTDPYQTANVFLPQVAFNNQPTFSAQSSIANCKPAPEQITSTEFGFDIRS